MTRILAVIAALMLASPIAAQTFPTRTDTNVTDSANIIDPETEARIVAKLAEYADDHDTEVVIVTLSSLRFYDADSDIEDYSTAMFNDYGIGDAEANNGILFMVFRDDQELRVEVGSGYDDVAKIEINTIMSDVIVPQFRNDNYAAGLEAGVDALLARVIDRAAAVRVIPSAAADSDTNEGSGNALYYILAAVAAAIAALIGLNRRNAAKLAALPCTNCDKTGLVKSREVLRAPTLQQNGAGETRLTCPSCGHVDATPYNIAKLKPEAPKGGGKSKGDGATGKW